MAFSSLNSLRRSALRHFKCSRQKFYATLALALLLITILPFLNGYLLEKQLFELQGNLRSVDKFHLDKSDSAQMADQRILDNCIGLRCPSWIPGAPFRGNSGVPFTPFVLYAPLGEIEDVQLRFADVRVLKSIATFRHLKRLKLTRLRTQSHDGFTIDGESLERLQQTSRTDWERILQRPLVQLYVYGCGVPDNMCQLLAERGTVKVLTIGNEQSLIGVSNLLRCKELETLIIGEILSLEDDDVRDGIAKCVGLKLLSLRGHEIGSGAIGAACSLESLEELDISTRMVDVTVYRALKGHKSLRSLVVEQPGAGFVVLENAVSILSLKSLAVSRMGLSTEQVASFEARRPDVELYLLGSL